MSIALRMLLAVVGLLVRPRVVMMMLVCWNHRRILAVRGHAQLRERARGLMVLHPDAMPSQASGKHRWVAPAGTVGKAPIKKARFELERYLCTTKKNMVALEKQLGVAPESWLKWASPAEATAAVQPALQPSAGQPPLQPSAGQPPLQPSAEQPPLQPSAGQPPLQPSAEQPPLQLEPAEQPPLQPSAGQPPLRPSAGQPPLQPSAEQAHGAAIGPPADARFKAALSRLRRRKVSAPLPPVSNLFLCPFV